MRKILIVFLVLLIPVFACISVSAYGVGDPLLNTYQRGYAPLQMDLVRDDYGEYTWPYDSCVYGTFDQPFSFCNDLMVGSVTFDGNEGLVNGSFYLPGSGGSVGDTDPSKIWFLNEELQIVDTRTLPSFEIQAKQGLDIKRVVISFYVVEPVIGGRLTDSTKDAWQFQSYELSGVFYASAQENMQIGNWIASLIRESDIAATSVYSMIHNLQVLVEVNRTSVETPGFDVRYFALENEPAADISNWAYHRALNRDVEVIDASSIGWFDWLLDSADAFLDLEFAPNLSIRTILYFVLVVGILVAFLKIMG